MGDYYCGGVVKLDSMTWNLIYILEDCCVNKSGRPKAFGSYLYHKFKRRYDALNHLSYIVLPDLMKLNLTRFENGV